MLVALGALMLVMTPGSGGRERVPFTVGMLALVPALAATQPWRRVGRLAMSLPLVLSATAVVVLLTAPMGWSSSRFPAYAVLGSLVFLVAAGYAINRTRRLVLASALALGGLLQFQQGFAGWWGHGDPDTLMVGTFFWHNQFAIYVAASSIIAMSLAITRVRLFRVVALACATVTGAGVVFSTSRASLALLVLGWLCLAPLALRAGEPRAALVTWAAAPLLVVAAVVGLGSGLFFPGHPYHFYLFSGSHGGAAGARDVTSLSGNGTARLDFAKAALAIWAPIPLTGGGFDSFAGASVAHMPVGSGLSEFPHNGIARALASGGLLFGLPVLLAAVYMALASLRTCLSTCLRRTDEAGVLGGAAVATLVLLAHTLVDFDWTYPSLCALLAVAYAIVYTARRDNERASQRRYALPRAAGAALAGLALLGPVAFGVTAVLHDRWHHGLSLTGLAPQAAVTRMLDAAGGPLSDPALAATALSLTTEAAPSGGRRLAVPATTARRAVAQTSALASLQPALAMQRAITMVAAGDSQQGLAVASAVATRYADHAPYLLGNLAVAQASAGQTAQARATANAAFERYLNRPGARDDAWYLVSVLQNLDGATPSRTTTCAFGVAAAALGQPPSYVHPMTADPATC